MYDVRSKTIQTLARQNQTQRTQSSTKALSNRLHHRHLSVRARLKKRKRLWRHVSRHASVWRALTSSHGHLNIIRVTSTSAPKAGRKNHRIYVATINEKRGKKFRACSDLHVKRIWLSKPNLQSQFNLTKHLNIGHRNYCIQRLSKSSYLDVLAIFLANALWERKHRESIWINNYYTIEITSSPVKPLSWSQEINLESHTFEWTISISPWV